MKGMSANLMSMGAIDFGIIIDGAVVMVEGIFVMLDHKAHKYGMERFNKLAKMGWIKQTGGELAKAIFFSKLIIIISLIPIFSPSRKWKVRCSHRWRGRWALPCWAHCSSRSHWCLCCLPSC